MRDENTDMLEILCRAEEGDTDAMMDVVMYMMINGNKDFFQPAMQERYWKYIRKLADAGNQTAYIWMGSEYECGDHVPPSAKKAIEYYQKAVNAGIEFGNECIALMYYSGKLVPADYKKAYEYLMKPKRRQSTCAKFLLGEMFRCGLYVERNARKACYYYKQATHVTTKYDVQDAYYWPSCFRLGQAKHYGKGIRKNIVEGRELVNQALYYYYNPEENSNTKYYDVSGISKQEIESELRSIEKDITNTLEKGE